ncbi:hypothetical protein [Hyphomonas pacifica]|uniref:Uncharacterized protein n=1 Tax=Hyphomonas pacifica TaxID=1280941 RepID=A0A8B2PR62_9PROT|nr:hypothetical protein [Hyphomonas pacifica]RAN30629.1 hypothetical protein HY3_05625 [Hyphomonas pacifica]
MAAAFDWPAGVEHRLLRDGYSREPEDLVDRFKMDSGPALRRLLDGAAGQRVKGTLSLERHQADMFEAWRADVLDRGSSPFNWIITDNARPVVARFAAQPRLTEKLATRHRYAVEIECQAPDPSPAQLAALAALEDAGPAVWPASVPFRIIRSGYSLAPEDGVIRSPFEGVHRQALMSRADGFVTDAPLYLRRAELAEFESWFETEAAFGVRDVLFPHQDGGTWRGHFHETYKISVPGNRAKFALGLKIYLEVVR